MTATATSSAMTTVGPKTWERLEALCTDIVNSFRPRQSDELTMQALNRVDGDYDLLEVLAKTAGHSGLIHTPVAGRFVVVNGQWAIEFADGRRLAVTTVVDLPAKTPFRMVAKTPGVGLLIQSA